MSVVEVADLLARVVVVGAVHRHEDRRQRALHPRRGVVEEHRVVEHALPELGEHVLQHGGPRADQVHPVVAEVPPDQRLRAQAAGRRRAASGVCASSVMWNSVTDFALCTNRSVSGLTSRSAESLRRSRATPTTASTPPRVASSSDQHHHRRAVDHRRRLTARRRVTAATATVDCAPSQLSHAADRRDDGQHQLDDRRASRRLAPAGCARSTRSVSAARS